MVSVRRNGCLHWHRPRIILAMQTVNFFYGKEKASREDISITNKEVVMLTLKRAV